ncbi:MAG: TVP38/TMEM64 family protein [Rhodospirillaceae bacterium]|nr:MAG: TVP38/TMEM64 family protein [Rhodospirillaceae bacterium]
MERRVLLIGLAAACIAFATFLFAMRFYGLSHALVTCLDTLQLEYAGFIGRNPTVVLATFVLLYALVVTLALPLTGTMDIVGGAVLGLAGFPAAMFSVCIGSIVPFLIARKLGATALMRFDSGLVQRVRHGFVRNGLQYLILMRLLPWAPCSVTTIISGALGMRLWPFLLGTGIGFVPAGLALNMIGRGLRRIGDSRDISVVALYRDSDFLLAVVGVGMVAILSLSRSLLSKRADNMRGAGERSR